MSNDRSPTAGEDRPHNGNGKNGGQAQGGLWTRLRNLFSGSRDASLRESLEGVIEQHDAGNGTETMRPDARSMMLNLLEFADLRVDDVMVPRADIIAVDSQASMRDLLMQFTEASHSRLPVYRETLDDPIGMVHIKDLMNWVANESAAKSRRDKAKSSESGKNGHKAVALSSRTMSSTVSQSELTREILFVPPSMQAGDLLVKMQSTRIHMAIVVDEYGGTDGLVTIEDIVEEIVGDIADEHDDDTQDLIEAAEDGNYTADARAAIEDVEELLGVDLLPDEVDEDTDTLGGFVFSILGRVPVRGELIKHDSGIEFEVLEADPRRVKRLKIHTRMRKKEQDKPNADEAADTAK